MSMRTAPRDVCSNSLNIAYFMAEQRDTRDCNCVGVCLYGCAPMKMTKVCKFLLPVLNDTLMFTHSPITVTCLALF